jgi:hypothetical protein
MPDKNNDPKVLANQIRNTREAEAGLRQFLSTDGPKGNNSDYKRGWARNFGRKTNEHSGTPIDDSFLCTDTTCWCYRKEDE